MSTKEVVKDIRGSVALIDNTSLYIAHIKLLANVENAQASRSKLARFMSDTFTVLLLYMIVSMVIILQYVCVK